MFDYVDPVGSGILASQEALTNYREIMDGFYQSAADTTNTAFTLLERFGGAVSRETIPWQAFPKTATANDNNIDAERFRWQDEYIEWRVERQGNKIQRIVFTTEFPEYYQALAEVSADALIEGIRDAIPGANPTIAELFGDGFNPNTATPAQRANRFRARSVVPFNAPANANPPNPWNNGTNGILCLLQRFNTMSALFNLATECAVPNPGLPASGQCAATDGACGPDRNSDPKICLRAQTVARIPRPLSLADPAGVHIVGLEGTWRVDNVVFDPNDSSANQGIWKVDRGGRRAILDLGRNVTLDNNAIVTGTQVSRVLTVGADVVSSDPNDLGPAIASAGAPPRVMEKLTRLQVD